MRPCLRPKRQQSLRVGPVGLREPIGAPYRERDGWKSLVAKTSQPSCEVGAGKRLACFVQQDRIGSDRQKGREFSVIGFGELKPSETKGPPLFARARQILQGKRMLGRGLAPPADEKRNRQRHIVRSTGRLRGGLVHPHLFEIVECANLRPEQMDHDVEGVDKNPIARS
jgi:hypothetical protein